MHIAAILNDVAMELEKDLENTKTRFHSMRLLTIIMDGLKISSSVRRTRKSKKTGSFKLLILSIENDGLEQAYEEGKISERAYRVYQRYLKSMEKNIKRETLLLA